VTLGNELTDETIVSGTLGVAGQTSTNGLDNTGLLANVGDITNTGNLTNGGNFTNAGDATIGGRATINGGIAVTGTGTITDGPANLTVERNRTSLTIDNAGGTQNGIVITPTSTTISGGTGTSVITLDDTGVTVSSSSGAPADLTVTGDANIVGDLTVRGQTNFSGAMNIQPGTSVSFGGNRLQNVAAGVAPTDAVNVSQLNAVQNNVDDVQDEARRGIAIAMALDTHLPDPGKQFRVNLGGGYYNGKSALGLTGAGRVNDDVAVYFGIGSDVDFNETGAKIGVSYQW
jgi:hypothetical protein